MKFNLSASLKLAWNRICASRFTIAYFVLSGLYCVLQTVIAIQGWSVNEHAGDVMKSILRQVNISRTNYAHLEPHTGILHLCQTNEEAVNAENCPIIWPIPGAEPTIINGTKAARRSVELILNYTQDNELNGLNIVGLGDSSAASGKNNTINATLVCIQAMKWPLQYLLNQKREDVAFVAFQIWVLGMSCVAIFNESIPHIYATFITHLIAALWSAFQLWSTRNFKAEYSKLIMGINDPDGYLGLLGGPGACDGQDMLPTYFKPRMDAELATAILNFISVFGSGYLAYRLIYIFGWSTFKHIGASVVINRIYKLALTLTILIQLALFYIVGSVALWIDQLFSGIFGRNAVELQLYKIWQIIVLILLIPWLTLGWFSVRREWRNGMLVFNGLSAFFLASWLAAIFSDSWRLTFMQWRFFSIIQVGAFISCLLTFVLGILCRIFCFGRGLSQYLNPPSQEDDLNHEFKPTPDVQWDAEKVGFPSSHEIPQLTKQPASQPPIAVPPIAVPPSQTDVSVSLNYRDPIGCPISPQNPFESPMDYVSTSRGVTSSQLLEDGSIRHGSPPDYDLHLGSYGSVQTGNTTPIANDMQRGNGTIASFMTSLHTTEIIQQQKEKAKRQEAMRNVSSQAVHGHESRDWVIE